MNTFAYSMVLHFSNIVRHTNVAQLRPRDDEDELCVAFTVHDARPRPSTLTSKPPPKQACNLIQPLRRRHGCLDRQTAHVLPPFLQQADQVVDGQHDVRDQLVLGHAHVADRHPQAQDFLQLELDGRFDFGDLGREIFVVRDGSGEFAGCCCVS